MACHDRFAWPGCRAWAVAFPTLGLALSCWAGAAWATDYGQLSLIEENDSIFFPTDQHYTQGLRLSYLTPKLDNQGFEPSLFDPFIGTLFPDSPSASRYVDWTILGQSIFTPVNIKLATPDPNDRPYAGWLYTGAGLVQDTGGHQLDDLEVEVGVVGPSSLAEQTQTRWHESLVKIPAAQGWSYQLHDEPGLLVSDNRKWRLLCCTAGQGFGVDLIPEAGVTVGNVMTYADTGGMARIGYNLTADYGPARILPGQSGSDYFDPEAGGASGLLGGYLYAGVEGRLVARNIFLDGNSFEASPHVNKDPLVGDLTYGAVAFLGRYLRATLSIDNRSMEFTTQQGPDRFVSISTSFHFEW